MNVNKRISRRIRVSSRPAILAAVLAVMFTISAAACGSNTPPDNLTPRPMIEQGNSSQNAAVGVTGSTVVIPTPTAVSPALVEQTDAAQRVLTNIYQRVDPAVVNIEIRTGDIPEPDSSGSGFVIDTDGHIVTNAHVVQGAKEILVTFYNGYTTTARVIGTDDYSDLAVIQVGVAKERLTPVTMGDSSNLQVGQRIVVIGNPFGLLSSMTTGIISATGRTLPSARMLNPQGSNQPGNYYNPSIIQVDAAINPGNSGGPLLDINGKVIGVAAAIRTESGTFEGVGFAVPISTVKRIVPQLIKNGKAEYSWLGIESISGVSGVSMAALAEPFKLPVDHGVLISRVTDNSPAAAAGLRGGNQKVTVHGVEVVLGGDIVVAVSGQTLRDMDALIGYLVANTAPGDTITLTIIRDNQTFDVKVLLQARPVGGS